MAIHLRVLPSGRDRQQLRAERAAKQTVRMMAVRQMMAATKVIERLTAEIREIDRRLMGE